MPPVRRLTATLAADVAGYSRLMEADEEGTHERVQAHLRELVDPKIGEHRGRIVKNTGDGLLAEFASVVDAVRCAVDLQHGMTERNAPIPPDKRVEFRVGINLGDVIAEEHDIFGDGVNVAARLEALAEPGGIRVSRVVRDQVRDRLEFAFEDLREQQVKNIARPVRVYALRVERVASAAPAVPSVPVGPRPVAAVPLTPLVPVVTPTPPAPLPPAHPAPVSAPRLSIVVLPFANLSSDPEQQYFADGITEDLTTDLSRIAGMFVISRNTAFTYRNKPVVTKQIGCELGVRYVLEGSVRRSDSRVRVTAQLIDAETDAHLWADHFDSSTADLFALQNEITSRIAIALHLELLGPEAARSIEHPDALDYTLQGRATWLKPRSRDVYAEAVSLFERALALDAGSIEARSWLATELASRALDELSDTPAADVARAEELATQAVMASARNQHAHFAKGQVLRAQRRPQEAIPEYETVIAFNRNHVNALAAIAWCKLYTGSIEEVIPLLKQAIRLSPRDPNIGAWYKRIGLVHLLRSRIDEAIIWFEKSRSHNPALSSVHAYLASTYALNGEMGRAAEQLAEARRLNRDGRYTSITRMGYQSMMPPVRELFEATYIAGLRKAGMREE
jgi:TolB-like protein/class 3 adenylate cyclase